jgi:hypothetical protein
MKAAGLVAGVAVVMFAAVVARAGEATEKRELLSLHDTVARFAGLHPHTCRGLTSLCPDRCGHSGDMAVFDVVRYVRYEKPGQYGDPQGKEFRFLVQDTMKNPKVPQELAARVAALKEGDLVRLTWRHEYVTRTEGGGSSSFPERPVAVIEKLKPEEADKLLENAPHGRDQ